MTDNATIGILSRLLARAEGSNTVLDRLEKEAVRHAVIALVVDKARRDMRPLLDALKDAGD